MVVEVRCVHCQQTGTVNKSMEMTVFWFNHEGCHKGTALTTTKINSTLQEIRVRGELERQKTKASLA